MQSLVNGTMASSRMKTDLESNLDQMYMILMGLLIQCKCLYLSIFLSISMSISLSFSLSFSLSIHLIVYLSIYFSLYIHRSIQLYIYLSIHLYASLYPPPVCLSLPVCLNRSAHTYPHVWVCVVIFSCKCIGQHFQANKARFLLSRNIAYFFYMVNYNITKTSETSVFYILRILRI